MSNKPKYSIILPTLNGFNTLSLTLPEMIKIDRDDIEWLISDNCSDDQTREFVLSFFDKRIRLVSPQQRLPLGRHLEFAYSHALGDWQGHIGDDDYIFPSRFIMFDNFIKDSKAEVIIGEDVNYHWPDYPDNNLSNTIDPKWFSGTFCIEPGLVFARKLLNTIEIYGGGSWICSKEIIDTVKKRCGYFASPQHVEFFALRAACTEASLVLKVDLPVFVAGRHPKSSGTQAYRDLDIKNQIIWDWSFEDNDPYKNSPFQYKGYVTISLDAALSVVEKYPEFYCKSDINWNAWCWSIARNIENLVKIKKLPPDSLSQLYLSGLKKMPRHYRLLKAFAYVEKIKKHTPLLYDYLRQIRNIFLRHPNRTNGFGWNDRINGKDYGIGNIICVPTWIEKTNYHYFEKYLT